MKLLVNIIWIISPLFIFSQGPIDGFFKGKGNADIAVGFGINRSTNYTGHPDSLYNLSYSAQQFNVFGQYGISDNFDAIVSLPFVFGATENKFQDLGLHLKYGIIDKSWNNTKWTSLVAGGVSFPASDYQADVSGALGRREKKIPLRLVNQLKMNNGVFLNLTASYFIRFDKVDQNSLSEYQDENPDFNPQQPSNHYSIMSRIGWASEHNFIEAFVRYQNTLDGIDYQFGIIQPIQLYEVDFLKIGTTYYYGGKENGIAVNLSYIPGLKRNIGNIVFAGVSFILKYRK